jgi:hypothetical protein
VSPEDVIVSEQKVFIYGVKVTVPRSKVELQWGGTVTSLTRLDAIDWKDVHRQCKITGRGITRHHTDH